MFLFLGNAATVPTSCNFEDALSKCKYTQDTTDDFDWTRKSGGTATRGTGPSADHTYGTRTGKDCSYKMF